MYVQFRNCVQEDSFPQKLLTKTLLKSKLKCRAGNDDCVFHGKRAVQPLCIATYCPCFHSECDPLWSKSNATFKVVLDKQTSFLEQSSKVFQDQSCLRCSTERTVRVLTNGKRLPLKEKQVSTQGVIYLLRKQNFLEK